MRTGHLVVFLTPLLMASSMDLDVGVPSGSPLDYLRLPAGYPAASRRTVTQDDKPGMTPLNRNLTVDFGRHLRWTPGITGTPTFANGGRKMQNYPPKIRPVLYMHCASFLLMIMLHPAQVSEREIVSYLLDIGEPGGYAANAARNEKRLRKVTEHLMTYAGSVPAGAPDLNKYAREEKPIVRQLIRYFPYESAWGQGLRTMKDQEILPVLVRIAEDPSHRLLQRNAVFALRLFDHPGLLPVLRRLLQSADKVIRNRALSALIRWRDASIVPWLIEQIDGKDVYFRSFALHALGKIGDPRAVDPILKQINRDLNDWEFLWAAVPALGRLRDNRKEVLGTLKNLEKASHRVADGRPVRLPDKPDRKGLRKKILRERVDMVTLLLKGKVDALRRKRVVRVNRKLHEELLAPAPPAPRAIEAGELKGTKGAAKKETPRAPAVLVKHRDRLLEYKGVIELDVQNDRIRIQVRTRADADDLRMILGRKLDGVSLLVRPRD